MKRIPKHMYWALDRALKVASVLLAMFMFSPPVFAQLEEDLEEIIVTGTRLRAANLEATSPVSVYRGDQIEAVNTVNIEEFLRDLPQFSPSVGAQGNDGNDGSATVDLRNLDEERTLVLVDGRRFTPFDSQGFVDLGMIPTSLIKRVEVLTGGASAVYGADAVAGVVNFIMKDDFEGFEAGISYGVTEEGDGDTVDGYLTMGGNFADGKGNAVVNISYSTSDEVTQGQRPFSLETFDDLLNSVGSITVPSGGVIDTIGSFQFSDSGGQVEPQTDQFNFNPFNLFQVPQDRWAITAIADYEINERLKVYTRATFANNEIDTIIAPSGTFFFAFNVPYADNPGGFLGSSAISRLALDDAMELGDTANNGVADGLLIGRRTLEVGPRVSQYENTAFQLVTGLEGELANNWSWEAFGQWGQTSRTQNFLNDLSATNVQAGISGCPAGSPAACVPVNIYGLNTITPEMANFIRLNLVETNKTDQLVLGGSMAGNIDAVQLPSASSPLALAAGIEFREESALNRPDDNYASGNSIGYGASSPVDTKFDAIEYYAEAALPLVDGSSFAELIVLEAGIRFSDYDYQINEVDNSFDTTTWKLQLGWSLNERVKLRGGFNRAVRTPSIQEAGLPLTSATGDLDNDPCEGTNPLGNPELTQLCIDTGVPASQIGRVTSIISGQVNNFRGGNANLEPEEADTYTVGFVYAPEGSSFIFTVDYYDISVDNAIVQLAEQDVIDGCYSFERNVNGRFCNLIARNSLGGLIGPATVGVNVAVQNSAILAQRGVDFSMGYTVDMEGWGHIDLDLNGNYLIENEQQVADFTPLNDCVGLLGNICQDPDHEWRFVQTTTWHNGPWDIQLRWQFLDSVTNDSITLSGNSPANFAVPTIDPEHYFDLTARYQINDRLQLRAGIMNLFDTLPPIVGTDYGSTLQNSGNTFPATYDPLGRRYFFGVRATL